MLTLTLAMLAHAGNPNLLNNNVAIPLLEDVDDASFDVIRDAMVQQDLEVDAFDEDGCPNIPRVEVCEAPGFWDSICGAKELQREDTPCMETFWEYARSTEGAFPVVPVIDPRTGTVENVFFEAYSPLAIEWDGFDATYAPYLYRLTHPANGFVRVAAEQELQWWDSNCSVQSCAEVAYESFQDYSAFEARVAGAVGRGDWQAVVDAAYDADGIAGTVLRSKSGVPLPALPLHQGRSYLQGLGAGTPVRESTRSVVYGWTPARAGELSTLTLAQGRSMAVGIPMALRALDDAPDGVPLLIDSQAMVELAAAFDDACGFSDANGLVTCDNTATTLHTQIAERFNTYLPEYDEVWSQTIPEQSAWPEPGTDPWDFHLQMSAAFSDVSTERLVWLEERQAEFAELERRRFALLASIGEEAIYETTGLCDIRDCTVSPQDIRRDLEALHEIRNQQTALLTVFDVVGCYGPSPTPCDWSPRWPAFGLLDHFTAEREEVFAECIQRTGDDFNTLVGDDGAPHWLVAQQAEYNDAIGSGICDPIPGVYEPLPDCEVRTDYLSDERAVFQYFDTVNGWARVFAHRYDFPVDEDTGQPTLAGTASDSFRLGDSNFNVNGSYEAGWDLPTLRDLPCALGASAHGQLRLGTKVFGTEIPAVWFADVPEGFPTEPESLASDFIADRERGNLVFADLMLDVGEEGGTSWAVFDVMGTELFAEVATQEATDTDEFEYHYVAEPPPVSRNERLIDQSYTTTIGPVPVNLSVGLAASVGYSARGEFTAIRCPDGAPWAKVKGSGQFRPFGKATAQASASAGIRGLAAIGVEANLNVVDVGIPVNTTVNATYDRDDIRPLDQQSPVDVGFDVDSSANVDITLLSGSIRGFVEVFLSRWARTLFSFSGYRDSAELFDYDLGADLEALQSASGITIDDPPDAAPVGPHTTGNALRLDRGECTPYERPEPDIYLDFDDQNIESGVLSAVFGDASFHVDGAQTGLVGQHGQAISGALDSAPGSIFPLGNQVVWSFWFRPDADDSEGTLLAHGTQGDTSGGIEVQYSGSDRVSASVACSEGGTRVLNELATLPAEQWHHVWVAAYSNGTIQMRVNGQVSDTKFGCVTRFSSTDVNLGHIVRNGVAQRPFEGRLDELAYWGSADSVNGYDARDVHAQGLAGLPLYGEGAAPPTGVTALSGNVNGTALSVSWTNPPSIATPDYGYDEVIVRASTEGYPLFVTDGQVGAVTASGSAELTLPIGSDRVYISTWARGPSGTRLGPQAVVTQPGPDLPDVSGLAAIPGDDEVRLTWALPGDLRVARVLVVGHDAPIDGPLDGTPIANARVTSTLDVGLHVGQDRYYKVWSLDGRGRLSDGVEVQTTTVPHDLDVTPPGALSNASAIGLPSKVVLSWTRPADVGAIRVEVNRVLGGLRRTLSTTATSGFTDSDPIQGATLRYELTPVDEAGNRGPTTRLIARSIPLDAPSDFAADVRNTEVDLSWTVADPSADQVTVVRTALSPANLPTDGTPICTVSPDTRACVDTAPPLDETLFYAAFSRAAGSSSLAAVTTAEVVSPSGPAGPDRVVHVGERVMLRPPATVRGSWSGVDGLIDDDGEAFGTAWFVPTQPGQVTLTLTGTDPIGAPVTDDVTLTVREYQGDVTGYLDNPFATTLVQGTDATMAVRGDGLWVRTPDGLTEVDASGNIVRTVPGSFGALLGSVDDGLLANTGNAVQFISLGSTPAVAWAEDIISLGNRVAIDGNLLMISQGSDVTLYGIDGLGPSEIVTFTAPAFPAAMALDADTLTAAMATFNGVDILDLNGLSGDVGSLAAEYRHDLSRANGVAFDDNGDVFVVQSAAFFGVPPEVTHWSVGDNALSAVAGPVDAPFNERAIRVSGNVLFVRGDNDVTLYSTADDLAVLGTAGANTSFTTDAQVLDDAVYVSSGQGASGSTAGVVRAPVSGSAPTYSPRTFDAFTSIPDDFDSSGVLWAQHQFKQVEFGDTTEMRGQQTLDNSSASFNVDRMLCLVGDEIVHVSDVGGSPHLVRQLVDGDQFIPVDSWPIAASWQASACTSDAVVVHAIEADVDYAIVYDLITGSERGRVTLPDWPFITLQTAGHQAVFSSGNELVLVDVDGGVTDVFGGVRTVDTAFADRLTPLDDAAWGRDDNGSVTEWELPSAVGIRHITTTNDGLAVDPASKGVVTTSSGALRHVRADAAPLLYGSWAGISSNELRADAGYAFVNPGVGMLAVRTLPVSVDGLGTGAPAAAKELDFRWDDPLVPDGVSPGEVDFDCVVTGGTCELTSLELGTGRGTLMWTLPSDTGDYELTLAIGTARWFATATDRVSVEAP